MLYELWSLGYVATITDEGKLKIAGPKKSEELNARIKESKAAIIEEVQNLVIIPDYMRQVQLKLTDGTLHAEATTEARAWIEENTTAVDTAADCRQDRGAGTPRVRTVRRRDCVGHDSYEA